MKLPRLAIDNYQFTLVVFLILIVAGIASYFQMPRMENPTVYISGGSVIVIYPGANPRDMEQLVAIPIEEAINELDDIRKITTSLRDGVAAISVEFEHGTDAQEKYNEMVARVNAMMGELPEDLLRVELIQWTSTDVNIVQLALVSEEASFARLDAEAGRLKKRIEKVTGVKKVLVHAIPDQEIRIAMDMEKMAQMNISLQQIIQSVQSANANVPGGLINISGKSFGVKTSGSFRNIDELKNTVVGSFQDQLIYLKNVADVFFDDEDNYYLARFNGNRAVFLSVQQKENLNIFKITNQIDGIIESYTQGRDDQIQLFKVFDQSETVQRRIHGFMMNLLQGILLVGLLVFLSIGFRWSVIVMMAIPFSVIVGLGIVGMAGFGLEQISIAALVVALGLLVDNSIVMVENVDRYLARGYTPREAAIEGVSEIGWPIVSATLTTILAFIPIVLLPDKAGDFIRSLPYTIMATLLVSLFITLTLSPLIASRIYHLGSYGVKRKKKLIERFLKKIIEGPYRSTLIFSLKREGWILTLAILALLVSVYIFRFVGVSYFPKAETPQMMIRVNMPEGTSLSKTDEAARYVESILDTIPLVKLYATNVGKGNPRIYYNIFSRQFARNFAEIYVELYDYQVDKFDAMVENLRELFNRYPGANILIKEFEQGIPIEAPVAVYITGENVEILKTISRYIENFIAALPGAVNVENLLDKSQTDLYFNINRDKAAMLGVPMIEIDRTIRLAINGMPVSKYRDAEGREYSIVMRLPIETEITLEDMDRIYVNSLSGQMIPLKQLASIEFQKASSLINRFNLERNATVLADLKKGITLDEVIQPVINELDNYPFPDGYGYYIAGELESRRETFAGMQIAILIAMLSVFGVLVFQFRSFVQPLIIFSAIPLAIIGSVWMLFVTGNTFSFTAFIGLISLVGIVVNNSIILVDYINKLISKGMEVTEAISLAGETRFKPIILTSLTTIGGLLPLTLQGGTLWAPMGYTIIGGLLTSTFLTLLVVPVLYKLLYRGMQAITVANQPK
jgi:multidrug efflux pump subunit AcrB